MDEKVNNGGGNGDQKPVEVTPEAFAKIQEQVENLNKGISSYREENKGLKTSNETLQKTLEELKTKLEFEADVEDDVVKLTPEEEKKFEALAKKKGLVSQTELTAERQKIQANTIKSFENQAVSEFLEKHPEYDTDENWQQILAEFQLYRTPADLEGFRKILSKIHKDFTGGSKEQDGRTKEKVENLNKGRLTLGGGHQGSGKDNDSEFENLHKKYPNLSREQIESRLTEIRSLYPKK